LPAFIEYLEMMEALDLPVEASKVEQEDAVRMMTMHGAKGLQYDLVIASNMAKGRFPLETTHNEPLIPKDLLPGLKEEIASWGDIPQDEREKRITGYEKQMLRYEERRLCYVAWTRAKKELVLTYAAEYGRSQGGPSTFLEEIGYRENKDCAYAQDNDELSAAVAPDSPHERHKAALKDQLIKSLDTDTLAENIERLVKYAACREKKPIDYKAAFKDVSVSEEEMKEHLARAKTTIVPRL